MTTAPTGDFQPAKPCPNCGHCPTCGRSNAWPYMPWHQWHPYGPYWYAQTSTSNDNATWQFMNIGTATTA